MPNFHMKLKIHQVKTLHFSSWQASEKKCNPCKKLWVPSTLLLIFRALLSMQSYKQLIKATGVNGGEWNFQSRLTSILLQFFSRVVLELHRKVYESLGMPWCPQIHLLLFPVG